MPKDEVAKVESGEVLSPEDLAFMEQMAAETRKSIDMSEDIRLPSLQVVQATGALSDSHKQGTLVHMLTDEEFDTADVIVCSMFKSRVRFPKQLGDPPLCTSFNALDGFGDPGDDLRDKGITGPNGGGDCTRCPEAPRGGSCSLNFNYVTLLVGTNGAPRDGWDTELPVGLRMKRTSIKTASRINAMMLDAKYPWSNVLTLSARREENDKGRYYVWQVAKARPATMPEMIKAAQYADKMNQAQRVSLAGEDRDDQEQPAPAKDNDIPF